MSATVDFLGFEVYKKSVDDVTEEIVNEISGADRRFLRSHWFACLNPHSYALSQTDERFARSLQSADWLVPDGIGVVLGARFLNGSVDERITGWDVFEHLNYLLNSSYGARVFFLGSSQKTLAKIKDRFRDDYPGLVVAGTYSPPFKDDFSEADNAEMVEAINSAQADILWVGMTAPKQEKWIFQNIDRLNVRFAGAIGAVFDFYAGNVKRSGRIVQKSGLEWFVRLLRNPRRLWRRTFISAPIFVLDVLKSIFCGFLQKKE